ncbi:MULTISPECIES: serine/threonine-protein kinase [Mycolicibacterium]|uniref:serine/threonine-protein kinase n=1 Tax=Mycolicibacterium TaxID=1866885 RepID=UPI000A16AA23
MFAHRYELRSSLGQGAQGEVYEAFDLHEQETVALKLLRPTPDVWAEAAILRRLADHHILPIRNADVHVGQPFLATVLAAHGSVDGQISAAGSAGLSTADTVRWVRHACHGIARGHDSKLVHNDIKPANLFLNDNHECVVADWGFAAAIDPSTGFALVPGATAETVAPEIAIAVAGGSTPLATTRSDIYSLGATAFWMLTGCPPIDLSGRVGVLARMQGAATLVPPRLQDVAPHVPRWVRDKIEKAMSIDPANRYDSAHAFAADLGNRPVLPRQWIRTDEHTGHLACWRGVPQSGATYVMCLEQGSTASRRTVTTVTANSGRRVMRGCGSATAATWPRVVRRLIAALG